MTRTPDLAPPLEPDEPEEEQGLPEAQPETLLDLSSPDSADALASGRAALARFARAAPAAPGVYRMIDAAGEVLYVGKAKSIRKRIASYVRPAGHEPRIARMIAATATVEFVTTATETEALLLEANLIKRLRPRFNVLMRDDKSFPYILIAADARAPLILKHRGARTTDGAYFGPFASAWAVNRTVTTLQRAFLLRSCSNAVFDSRTRPCLLHQIKRCSAPCTGEIDQAAYAELVSEAKAFLSGRSQAVKERIVRDMEAASDALDFEHAAVYRDRLAALSAIQSQQGINPRGITDADVFGVHQSGGFTCVQVFFFRTGQNWGNRAYFPRADRALSAGEVLGAFIAQFYDDKPAPRLILVSDGFEDCALLSEALSVKAEVKIEIACPQRGEKREVVEHAVTNAREALGRKLAETSSQRKLLDALAQTFGLQRTPRRIEVYDNSHIQGAHALGAMVVAGPEGFRKNQYRKFNIRSAALTPGDDYAMIREVLTRRFKRLMAENAREAAAPAPEEQTGAGLQNAPEPDVSEDDAADLEAGADETAWPDLVIIDGGQGQLTAARETLAELGVDNVPLVAVAKGPDRDAGRETFFLPGRAPFRLPPRDPLLYFVERLRDEAHRFAIGSHRARRGKSLREGGLQEIAGIGPTRKRALLHHFGTLKAIERASISDLARVPGVSAEVARKIYGFFHNSPESSQQAEPSQRPRAGVATPESDTMPRQDQG